MKAAAGAIAAAAVVAFPAAAFADVPSAYQSFTGPTNVPGGFSTVQADCVVAAGASSPTTCDAVTINGATVTVTVPVGAFPNGAIVTFTSGQTSAIGNAGTTGDNAVLALGINFYDPNASTPTKLSPVSGDPVSVAIAGTFAASDAVVQWNTTSAAWQPLSGAQVSASSVSLSITSDPDIAVLSATTANATTSTTSASLAAAGDTSVHTGKPFLLEEIIGGLLVVGGSMALWLFTRRRTSARRN